MLDELREEVIIDFTTFFKEAWHIFEGTKPYIHSQHIKVIAEHLEAAYRREIKTLVINIPPRSSKTNLISIAFPAWVWLQNPEEKFLYASYASNLSAEHSRKCRQLIESDWYQSLSGLKLRRATEKELENNKGGCRIATSVGGVSTGKGASILVCIPSHTLIKCKEGVFSIGDIVNNKLDVFVLSYNHDRNKTEFKKIKRYDKNPGKELYEIEFDDGSVLECTEEHPVFIENKGYVNARDLQEGDTCLSYL